jgi:hypothetical protein
LHGSTQSCDGIKGDRSLDASYQALFQDDEETRLQQAGVRLAELLTQLITVP